MGKRKPEYEIDEKQIDNDDNDEHKVPGLGKINTPEEIAQRRIIKLIGAKAQDNENNESSKTKLIAKLDEGQQKEEKQSNGKQGQNGDKKLQEQSEKQESEKKQTEEKQQKSSLFGNINITPGSSLFSNNNNSSPSLFSGSLFSNNPPNTGALFSGGLFTNNGQNTNNTSIPNIFATGTNAGGLFGNMPINQQITGGLFGNLAANNNNNDLFGQKKKEGGCSDDDNGGEDDDEPNTASPEPDVTKVENKYQYEEPFVKLFEKNVTKFKLMTNDVLDKGFVSIEKLKDNESAPVTFVYRNQIKKIIYQANIYKGLSKVSKIGDNLKNIKVTCISFSEDKKPQAQIVKLQFQEDNDGEEFIQEMEKHI
ncbi:hypothetical protein IMG5_051080 [Ichthyophthirius multifiliis]|uniref:Uncharacterized protein n=1 Tax=Ichthyophthirius multifiliis TaxID=5932 RepID=G0QMQ5_ICHMU|nr:hypothetical protein IMG5_051080 [Ichthyophthirius multifiliis]EGR33511.1 hypothetical protein IMG5_051080 [Ichthyophthirius multifiliis]|eukprot:XP_004037497.1 hypothetical protein IMG5_051080 [Ichthyophthirius multifiliis]